MEKIPRRKNIRLKHYDYSESGYYFITICTKDKKNFFWKHVGETCGLQFDTPALSNIGEIINDEINKIRSFYNEIEIDKYVIMPNHIHMIIVLHGVSGALIESKNGPAELAPTPTVSRIIQQFKGSITKQVGFSLWQKSFYDHIIRNQKEYEKIYEYIETNPLKWEEDKYYI